MWTRLIKTCESPVDSSKHLPNSFGLARFCQWRLQRLFVSFRQDHGNGLADQVDDGGYIQWIHCISYLNNDIQCILRWIVFATWTIHSLPFSSGRTPLTVASWLKCKVPVPEMNNWLYSPTHKILLRTTLLFWVYLHHVIHHSCRLSLPQRPLCCFWLLLPSNRAAPAQVLAG